MNRLARLVAVSAAAYLLVGCAADESMSNTVKPNPAMANRYKQPPPPGGAAPKGVGAVPANAGSGGEK